MLEPSSIDLTILSSRGRRKQTALGAMLEVRLQLPSYDLKVVKKLIV